MNNNNNNTKNNKSKTDPLLAKAIKTLIKQNRRSNRITRRNNRRRIKRNNRKRMPAATVTGFAKQFKVKYQDGNTVTVTGRDLIYKIPDTLQPQEETNIITVIPANPAYWIGTRVAALAQGYQNYRPLMFKVHYVPQCAVTQQGNVLAGTLWNQAPEQQAFQQSLRTSNGGFLTQCYKPVTSNITMKSNLQYNLYRMGGQFDQESNPFIFLAMAISCTNSNNQQIIPGYFYVSWSFTFKNPIGQSITYLNSGLITYGTKQGLPINKTAVYLKQNNPVIPCGALLQLENVDNDIIALYNGSKVDVDYSDVIWQFSNTTVSAATRHASNISYDKGYADGLDQGKILDIFMSEKVSPQSQAKTIYVCILVPNNSEFAYVYLYVDGHNSADSLYNQNRDTYWAEYPDLKYQDFGDISFLASNEMRFTIPKKYVTIHIIEPDQKQINTKSGTIIITKDQKDNNPINKLINNNN